MTQTHPHTMQMIDGRIRAVYVNPETGREYYIVDDKRIYLPRGNALRSAPICAYGVSAVSNA